MYAHYTQGSKTRPARLEITRDIESRDVVHAFNVPGKIAARKLAKEHGAKPWNF